MALSVAASARPAGATEPTRGELAAARDLFAHAETDEDAGRWGDALEKLRRAGAVKMTPGIRFHVALCEERLGRFAAALTDYVAAQDAAREGGNKDVLDAVVDPLAQLRARTPTITLWLPTDMNDVAVSMDGAPVASGSLGVPLPVDTGSHTIDARAPNRAPFSTTVTLIEKQALAIAVLLPPLASPPMASIPTVRFAARPEHASRAKAVVASAGALALVGFGVGAFFVAGAKQSTAESQCEGLVSCEGLKGPVRTWDALALTGWIAGAGAGALAVYLWTRPRTPSGQSGGAVIRVGPGSMEIVDRF